MRGTKAMRGMGPGSRVLVILMVLLSGAVPRAQEPTGDWETRRQCLGKEDPYRILVDKVLMQSTGWVMQPEHAAEIAAAGFNVVVPRLGADDDERVRRAARIAVEAGLFYMPWIRGTQVSTGPAEERATAADGRTGNLASPNGTALWDTWHERLLFYARLSRDVPSLLGVFMDFENYDTVKVGGGMCYELSYDAPILQRFAEDRGLVLPEPLPAARAAWLKAQGVEEAFRAFQTAEWRRRARELRDAIDTINPAFQFAVYPAGHSLFIKEAVWREWHTQAAPLTMAEVDTYWRSDVSLSSSLQRNRAIMSGRRAELDRIDPDIRYMAGLDPIVKGANAEFEGKSAVMGAEIANGYWVFYEGPTYGKQDHADCFAWFRRANNAILRQDFGLWREAEETPNPLVADVAGVAAGLAGVPLEPFSTAPLPPEELKRVFTHRPAAGYQILLEKGERLRGQLIALKHVTITSGSLAVVVTPSGKILGHVTAEIGTPAEIDFEAPERGVYGMAISSGRGKGQLRLENRYVCLAGPRIQLVGDQTPALIVPRAGATSLDFTVTTYVPGEHVRVTLSDPDGAVAVDRNTREQCPLIVKRDVGATQRRPWSLTFTEAVEDIDLTLGDTCEPRLATHEGRLLVAPP